MAANLDKILDQFAGDLWSLAGVKLMVSFAWRFKNEETFKYNFAIGFVASSNICFFFKIHTLKLHFWKRIKLFEWWINLAFNYVLKIKRNWLQFCSQLTFLSESINFVNQELSERNVCGKELDASWLANGICACNNRGGARLTLCSVRTLPSLNQTGFFGLIWFDWLVVFCVYCDWPAADPSLIFAESDLRASLDYRQFFPNCCTRISFKQIRRDWLMSG